MPGPLHTRFNQLPQTEARRRFLKTASAISAAMVSGGFLGGASTAKAAESTKFNSNGKKVAVTDADILNFALNLEYLEAEFYLRAIQGTGLTDDEISGTGGTHVPFANPVIAQYAEEIAGDEHNHVLLLRAALGKDAVARPTIDLETSFTNAAIAAGVISSGQTFSPFDSDADFLLGAFIFEDVGVTAYHGAAPYIKNSAYLSAAAGILAVEAYHASEVRTVLFSMGQTDPTLITIADKISALRAAADGSGGDGNDQGIVDSNGNANIVPADDDSIAFSRTFDEVLSIVYLGSASTPGGFFPNGTNGVIH
jgi:hypothetical protein